MSSMPGEDTMSENDDGWEDVLKPEDFELLHLEENCAPKEQKGQQREEPEVKQTGEHSSISLEAPTPNPQHTQLHEEKPYYGSLLAERRKEDISTMKGLNYSDNQGSRQEACLFKDLCSFHNDETLMYISIAPIDGNLRNCLACLESRLDSQYGAAVFWIHMTFPELYPMKPPTIRFITPIYHPNIDSHGRICLGMFDRGWSPCLTARTILLSILSLIHDPMVENDEGPVSEIGKKYKENYEGFCEKALLYAQYAKDDRPETSYLINIVV